MPHLSKHKKFAHFAGEFLSRTLHPDLSAPMTRDSIITLRDFHSVQFEAHALRLILYFSHTIKFICFNLILKLESIL